MRIAILSNVTLDSLVAKLKKQHQVWVPTGFAAWMETAVNPPADLIAFEPEAIYILLDSHFTVINGDVDLAKSMLRMRFPGISVVAVDSASIAGDYGEVFYEKMLWDYGSMPWSLVGLKALAKIFSFKKVLALDLDNTLWQGVIGEDGVAGIVPDRVLQEKVLGLKKRGILLAILSKNNPEDVSGVWVDPRMVLKKDDFVAERINWNDKSANLRELAETLNLGLDAFVFVDDNPAERAQMRAMCPEVTVAEFPVSDIELYFPAHKLTAEDLRKTEQYHAEAARKNFAATVSFEDYLKGLEIRTEIHPIDETEIPRVAQLSQKTNQFNVCTNRYSENEIRAFAADGNRLLVTLHAGDRFGDQGLVAFVLAEIEGSSARIRDWVMSCRVMNRRIEFTVQAEVERLLTNRGVDRILAEYRPTPKNAPVNELFEKFSFVCESTSSAGVKSYVKTIQRKECEDDDRRKD